MVTDSNKTNRSDNELRSEDRQSAGMSLFGFLALAVIAFLVPFVVVPFFGVHWGAGAAISIFVFWVYVMPTTCMNGGLICSFVATMLLVNAIAFVVATLVRVLFWFCEAIRRPNNGVCLPVM
ncbi:MAG: hypothetical protein WCH39_11620 [Schlesneria sp.]